MREVRLLVSAAGDDFAGQPGDIVRMPDDQAQAWADGRRGELVDPGPEVRTVTPSRTAKRASRQPAKAGKS